MRKTLSLLTAVSLLFGASPTFASLGLQSINAMKPPELICLQRDFGYLHETVARFLAGIPRYDGIAPNYASEALKTETEALPYLLRQHNFPEEAELVEKQIAFMYNVGCVARK